MSCEFLFRLNTSFLHTCKSNCVYSACVRASTQCQFPNPEGSRREELMRREIQRVCFFFVMSLTEFSVNALGMSPGHVHMTNMTHTTVWGYVRKCAETHCLNNRMAKHGSVSVIFMSPSRRRRRRSIRNDTTYTMCFRYGRVLGSEGLRKRRHSGFRRVQY